MRVLSVGHALIDVVVNVEELAKKDGESRILSQKEYLGGSALNFAFAMKKLGANVSLFSNLGADKQGKRILTELKREEIGYLGTVSQHERTGYCLVIKSLVGDIVIYSYLGASSNVKVNEAFMKSIKDFDHIHISNIGPIETLEFLNVAKKYGKTVSYDIGRVQARSKFDDLLKLKGLVDYMFLSNYEYMKITGNDHYRKKLIVQIPTKALVRKLGAKGSMIYEGKKQTYVPAIKLGKIVSTLGAGDAYAASFIYHVNTGHNTLDSAILSSIYAGLKIRIEGGNRMPDKDLLIKMCRRLGYSCS